MRTPLYEISLQRDNELDLDRIASDIKDDPVYDSIYISTDGYNDRTLIAVSDPPCKCGCDCNYAFIEILCDFNEYQLVEFTNKSALRALALSVENTFYPVRVVK